MFIERIRLAVPPAYQRPGDLEQKSSVEAQEALQVAPDGRRRRQEQQEYPGRQELPLKDQIDAEVSIPEASATTPSPVTKESGIGHIDIVV